MSNNWKETHHFNVDLQVAKFRYATHVGNSSLQTAVPKTPDNMEKDDLPHRYWFEFKNNSYWVLLCPS
jgi:hypothetical protein